MNYENNASLDARLNQLRDNLARQASHTRIGNILTLLVGLIALGAFGFYFYWGYNQFSEVVQHERVADTVVTMVDDNLPSIRKSVEEEVRKGAPGWAEGLSKQLRDSLPSGRKKLKDYVIDRANNELAKGTVLTQAQFTKFLRENKVSLKKDIVELSKDPNLAENAVAELEKSLEAQLNADLKSNSREMLYVLAAFSDKLGKLSKNRDLDQTELIERRLAMIARHLAVSTSRALGTGCRLDDGPRRRGPSQRCEEGRVHAGHRSIRGCHARAEEGRRPGRGEEDGRSARTEEARCAARSEEACCRGTGRERTEDVSERS